MSQVLPLLVPCCSSRPTGVAFKEDRFSSALSHLIVSLAVAIILGLAAALATYFLAHGITMWMAVAGGAGVVASALTTYVTLRCALGKLPEETTIEAAEGAERNTVTISDKLSAETKQAVVEVQVNKEPVNVLGNMPEETTTITAVEGVQSNSAKVDINATDVNHEPDVHLVLPIEATEIIKALEALSVYPELVFPDKKEESDQQSELETTLSLHESPLSAKTADVNHEPDVHLVLPIEATEILPIKALEALDKKILIKGKIAINTPRSTGALGKNTSLLFTDTKEVQRTDLKDWQNYPNEMLIEFIIFGMEGKKLPLKNHHTLFLPSCLIIHNDDYTQWKKEGEKVEFYYKNYHYELIIAQKESRFNRPWEAMIADCERSYYEDQKGRSILPGPRDVRGKPIDQTQYPSPMFMQHHYRVVNQAKEMTKQFREEFKEDLPLIFPVEPLWRVSQQQLTCILPVKLNDVRYFISDTSFAIYARVEDDLKMEHSISYVNGIPLSTEEFPELWPDEYLLIGKFDETITRDLIEKGHKEVKDGKLIITPSNFKK